MVALRKADGTLSKTMLWNSIVMAATAVFGVGVTLLPEIHTLLTPTQYVLVALIVKAVDIFLRQITTMPVMR